MKSHISRITSVCFYQLRQLRAVRGQLGQGVTGRLVSAFILSRLDYCNAILVGLPASTLAPLQRVMHAAARGRHQGMRPRHTDTQSPALASSQAQDRVQVMSAGSSSHQLTGTCLLYLQNRLTTTASVSGRASNRSASNNDLVKQSTRLKLGDRAFAAAGPCVWNRLHTELKAITDTRVFQRKPKSFFYFR